MDSRKKRRPYKKRIKLPIAEKYPREKYFHQKKEEFADETCHSSSGAKENNKTSKENSKWFLHWLVESKAPPAPKFEKLSPDGPDKTVMNKKTIINKKEMRTFLIRKPVTTVDIVRAFAPKIRKAMKISDDALLIDMWIVIKQLNPYVQTIAGKKYYSLKEDFEMTN